MTSFWLPAVVLANTITFNVRDWGAYGDGAHDDSAAILRAFSAAKSIGGGTIYFPPGTYLCSVRILDTNQTTRGITFKGIGRNASILKALPGSGYTLSFYSTWGSGGVSDVSVQDLTIDGRQGAAGHKTLEFWNVLHFTVERVLLYGCGCPLSIQGSGNSNCIDVEGYLTTNNGPIAALWVGSGNSLPHANDGTLTNSGPCEFTGCQFTTWVGAPAVIFEGGGDTLSGAFGVHLSTTTLNTETTAVIDGTTIIDGYNTTVTIEHCHTESNWSGNSTGADFVVGKYRKAGYVAIRDYDGNGYGNPNPPNQRNPYAVADYGAYSLIIEGGRAPGYTSAAVWLATGAPAAGDYVEIRGFSPVIGSGGSGVMLQSAQAAWLGNIQGPWNYSFGNIVWADCTLAANINVLAGYQNLQAALDSDSGAILLRGGPIYSSIAIAQGTTLFTLPSGIAPLHGAQVGASAGFGIAGAGILLEFQNNGNVLYSAQNNVALAANARIDTEGLLCQYNQGANF